MEEMLIITPEFPFPPDGGGPIRLLSLIQIYAGYFDITLLSYCFDDIGISERKKALLKWCKEVIAVKMEDTEPVKRRSAIMSITRGIPFNSCKFIQKTFSGKLKELLLRKHYKYIVLEHTYMLPYTRLIKSFMPLGSITILDAHNFETNLCRDKIKCRGGLRKLFAVYTYICMKRMEKKYAREYDTVFAASDIDMRHFKSAGVSNVCMVPNIVSVSEGIPDEADEKSLIFCGILSYFPNREGVGFFYENIYRKLKSDVEELKWYIVGREPDEYIRLLGKSNSSIIVTGYVKDVRDYYKKAVIAVVPLLSGSGTRLKILDAFNNGVAVISTSKGCEGLDVRHLYDIYIADTPKEFIKGIKELLADTKLRDQIRYNAKRLVCSKYSKEAVEMQIAGILTG